VNETIKNILERRSIRGYEATMPKDEDIELIVKCGEYAATAMGKQAWHFTVLQNRELMDAATEASRRVMLASPDEMPRMLASSPDFDSWRGAPMAIVVSTEDSEPMSIADCANATQNMAVAAQSLGLGTCYLGSFKIGMLAQEDRAIIKALGIPEGFTPAFALAVGYGNQAPDERIPRREGAVNYVK